MRPLYSLAQLLPGLLFALMLSACAPGEPDGPTVLAPSSMQEALEAVADAWEGDGHERPALSFAGTAALVRQAERGAPADIIITADTAWMDWLAERNLVESGTRRVLVGNALVLIAASPADSKGSITESLRVLGSGRLAMGDPQSVPAGRYGRAALGALGLWDAIMDRIVPTENVRAALALVEAGEARFGIVYATDAQASGSVHIVDTFDFRDTPEIVYPAARLSSARHPQTDAFLQFLSSSTAHDIYAAHGFIPYEMAP
ncbi:molybdate ABC transporter substrate-binding protein [Erythrobacter alti]|uniref:molybdate ABC transporter substrate-binding protein n=1 Tax=Erythrobacter alti TaxID=1896145 RepID=UPI0030F3CAB5